MDRSNVSTVRRTRRRWLTPAVLLGVVALVASACGSATNSPANATIEYSIWGDPAELASQQAVVDAFHVANPDVNVKVNVSDWDAYWTKLETGLAGGAAPDVFAMDGPLFHDYQARDCAPGPQAVHRQGQVRPDPARRSGRGGLHHGGWWPVRPATRPQHGGPVLQQGDVRCGRAAVPGRHVGLGQARRSRQAADPGHRRRRDHGSVGPLHGDHGHGERLAVLRLAERRRHHGRGRQDHRRRQPAGRWRDPVPAGPDLQAQDPAGAGPLRRGWRCLRAGSRGHGDQRVLAGRRRTPRPASTSGSPRCRPARPAGSPRSTRPGPWSTSSPSRRTPPGRS